MLDLDGWLPRGDRVPLDESPGDGAWVLATRGHPDEVLRALDVRPEADRDVHERVAAARRVVDALGGPQVALWLDLRSAEAGHVARRNRGPNLTDTVFVLPWLVARAGDREVRLVRTLNQRVKRGFVRGGSTAQTTAARLDELVLLGQAGVERRPVRLDRLAAIDWAALDQDVPDPATLPATAPGQPGTGARAPVAVGLIVAAALLLAAPLAVSAASRRPGATGDAWLRRALLDDRPDPASVEAAARAGGAARPVVREALRSWSPWTRANALVAGAAVLSQSERLRALDRAVADPDAIVQRAAVRLLAREGELGLARLQKLVRTAGADPDARAEALLVVLELDPPRAQADAMGIVGAHLPAGLRRACYHALAVPGGARAQRVVDRLLGAVAGESDPGCRARAACSLAALAPEDPDVRAQLAAAFTSTLARFTPPPTAGELDAQRLLAAALVRARLPRATLAPFLAHPGLGAPAAELLARAP